MAFRASVVVPVMAGRSSSARFALCPASRWRAAPISLPLGCALVSPRRWYADKKPEPHGKPGHAHSSVKDMVDSGKQEIKEARDTLADAIAGGHAARSLGGLTGKVADMTYPIKIPQHVPKEAWYFGAAGLVPYLSTSLASIYLARQASMAKAADQSSTIDFDTADALLYHVQNVQLTYGAIILSFVGAIHWGFEFSGYGGRQGAQRYIVGLLPLALAWPSLLLQPAQGLTVQLLAFFLAWYTDNRATSWGWAPRWYSVYRFGLTAVVGSTIIVSLVGASYFDPKLAVMGIGESSLRAHDEAKRRVKGDYNDTSFSTTLQNADVTLEAADEDADAYLQLRDYGEERRAKEKEEQEAKEAEEKQAADEAEEARRHESEKKTAEVKPDA